MKKIVSSLLIILVMLMLVGCSNNTEDKCNHNDKTCITYGVNDDLVTYCKDCRLVLEIDFMENSHASLDPSHNTYQLKKYLLEERLYYINGLLEVK